MDLPITQRLDQGILRITMNRPDSRNSLSEAMLAALQDSLDAANANQEVRVIILAANGPVYCAGHDMKEITAARQMTDGGRSYFQDIMRASSTLMQTIVKHRCPVIADIRAMASAAGCQIIASCDLAIASEEVQLTAPGVNIGLFCSTPMVALSRNISRKHAMEMLLCGEMISAQRAEQIGLINRVVAPSQMDDAVSGMAKNIASKSAMTVQMGKSAFYAQAEMDLAGAYEYAAGVMVENLMKNDAREGIGAFIEKRTPRWSDD